MKKAFWAFALICLTAASSVSAQNKQLTPKESGQMQVVEGYITVSNGIRLFFQKMGTGERTLIIPNAIYMVDDFAQLAKDRTIIFYDSRNRGHSDEVTDESKLKGGINNDVDDLEAVRRHFGLNKMDLLAHSYLGAMVAIYAMKYPEHVNRVIQIAPPPPNMAKQYPPNLSNIDEPLRDLSAKLMQIQSKGASKDPVEVCKEMWAVMKLIHVFDPANVSKISKWGFCELPTERNSSLNFSKYVLPSLLTIGLKADDYAKASIPVLIIHGTKDRAAAYGGGREWAMSLPNARLVTIENVGHASWAEAPQLVFGSIMTFLDGKWPEAANKVESLDIASK